MRIVSLDEPDRLTSFLAYEPGFPDGHHNVYFRDAGGQVFDVTGA